MNDAVQFAIEVHQLAGEPQYRKGKAVPYVTHPLAVGLILSQAGASEDIVLAGILHDVIEDSDSRKAITKEMISERFGASVANLVDAVSEKNKSLGWHERKEAALEEIKLFSPDALLVKSADVISNNTELIRDYDADGPETFDRFNASLEEVIFHTLQVISTIRAAWSDNPLDSDLQVVEVGLQRIASSN